MKIMLILPLFMLNTCIVFGQQFLNGSFEKTTSKSCGINLTNADYNSIMANSIAFGIQQSTDILNIAHCRVGKVTTAQEGQWFIGLDTFLSTNTSNAISMELSDTLIKGKVYSISYYDCAVISQAMEQLLVGLSTTDSTFGDIIYTSTLPDTNSWTQRIVYFTAPNSGKYITLKLKTGQQQRYIILDNFSLNYGTDVDSDQELIDYKLFPNPVENYVTVELGEKFADFSVSIINVMGTTVLHNNIITSPNPVVDLSNLESGLYICKLSKMNGSSKYYKLIKN